MTAGLLLLWFNETTVTADHGSPVYFCLSTAQHTLHNADTFSYVYKYCPT